jgi:hypothetical protein
MQKGSQEKTQCKTSKANVKLLTFEIGKPYLSHCEHTMARVSQSTEKLICLRFVRVMNERVLRFEAVGAISSSEENCKRHSEKNVPKKWFGKLGPGA